MGSRFLPRLVNGPFGDPALYVPFRHQNRALLFDLGDISALAARDILKISHIFVTHTHMDHFIGFDHVLRLLLGRDKDLHIIGPQGFLSNLSGKLAGYCWNLVGNYRNRFALHATELHPDRALVGCFPCHTGFVAETKTREIPFDGTVLNESGLTVRAVHLDHGTPVLAFALEERFHINIIKDALHGIGLQPGPWLTRFKSMLYDNADPKTMVDIPTARDGRQMLPIPLGKLQTAIARIRPGQRLAYIADAAGTPENMERMVSLAKGVDILFVEAAFSHLHHGIALQKQHLTARQAGELARFCGVRQYHLFHYSPRYMDCPETLEQEAQAAFKGQPAVL
jgi:ribonuclease Z